MDWTPARDYFSVHADQPQNRRRPSARMAWQAPHESARARKRGRDLNPASQFPWDRPLASPEMAAARQAVERVLKGHEPFPALAVDRHWQLVSANASVAPLLAGVDEALLKPPVNVLRLSLHPSGLAPRIANLTEWRAHLLMRLRTQIGQTADAVLIDLLAELSKFPATNMLKPLMPPPRDESAGVFVPFQLVTDAGKLSFLSTTTVFGTPIDVTLSELALECFFPADEATAQALQR